MMPVGVSVDEKPSWHSGRRVYRQAPIAHAHHDR